MLERNQPTAQLYHCTTALAELDAATKQHVYVFHNRVARRKIRHICAIRNNRYRPLEPVGQYLLAALLGQGNYFARQIKNSMLHPRLNCKRCPIPLALEVPGGVKPA